MLKKLLLLLLPLLFLTSHSAARENNLNGKMNLSQAIDKVRNAIVQVRVKISHSQEEIQKNPKLKLFKSSILGTGFFVNDAGYVVTANHVVSDFINDEHAHLKVYVAYPNIERGKRKTANSFQIYESNVVGADEIHDLALLKLNKNPFRGKKSLLKAAKGKDIGILKCTVPELDKRKLKDGENIAVSGYPLDINTLITTTGNIASSSYIDLKAVQIEGAPLGFAKINVSDAYLADLTVNHGNSGGPVFSVDNGKIIGVCVSFLVANTEVLLRNGKSRPVYTNENQPLIYNSRIANIIPVKYVIELLKKNGVEYLGQ